MSIIKTEVDVEIESCCVCGGFIALTKEQKDNMKRHHHTFYCPLGHGQSWPAETDAERLQRKLEQAQAQVNRLGTEKQELARQLDAVSAQNKSMKKHVAAGLCPHCRRHFVNLERHVQSKHKEQRRP